eukprot:6986274-Prymnesium_polylepis.1
MLSFAARAGQGVLVGTAVDVASEGRTSSHPSPARCRHPRPPAAQRLGGFNLPRPAAGRRGDPKYGGTGGSVRFFVLRAHPRRV